MVYFQTEWVASFTGIRNKNPVSVIGSMPNAPDWKEQADCYNVLFDYLRKNYDLFKSITWWSGWMSHADAFPPVSWDSFFVDLKPLDILDYLYGKPAEKVVQANWRV